MHTHKLTIAFVIVLIVSFPAWSQQQPLRLWYDAPATYWEACVPLGNGRLGAMPDGGITKENIVLNDITLWSGGRQDADEPDAYKYLPDIQKLLLEGKNIEAQELMSKHFVCKGKGSGLAHGANVSYGSYEVLGNLGITYNYGTDSAHLQPAKYYRDLQLENAIATTSFAINNITYTREYFTSFDDDVIMIKLKASHAQKINFQLTLNRPEQFETTIQGAVLQMAGN